MLKIVTGAFLLVLILIIVMADGGTLPEDFLFYKLFPAGDQMMHFLLMGIAALLVNLTLGAAMVRVGPLMLLKGSLIIGVIVTLEEFSQIFVPGRFFQVADLLANWLGILCLGRAAILLVERPTRQPNAA